MSRPFTGRSAALRAVIEAFLQERLDAKLKGLPDDDPKRATLTAQFEFAHWIDDAARRAGQIQVVTHALKGGHPDARGTSLHAPPHTLPAHALVGTHCLQAADCADDVVGNAAALDVYKFLRLAFDGQTLLTRLAALDADLLLALSDDDRQARAWADAFAGVSRARGAPSSHTLAKQLYWLVGDMPGDDNAYHLLAPLYASSLAHRVFRTISEDRFGEDAKVAREARRRNDVSAIEVHEYPHLAVQKLGGTKPQNISQLNSERGGANYLLASLPPLWVTTAARPPYGTDSVFRRFGRRDPVKALVKRLKRFLESDPPPNQATRDLRDTLVAAVIDELFQLEQELRLLDPGWSAHADCRLPDAERCWLDPWRSESDEAFASQRAQMDWPLALCGRFANWLNDELNGFLLFGDAPYGHWYGLLEEEFKARQREGLIDA
jgi:CRISPR-associated protein Csy1